MPADPALIDSGPLYALFDRRDAYHLIAVEFIKHFPAPLITNLGVISEVHFLLNDVNAQVAFLTWMSHAPIRIEPVTRDDFADLSTLLKKYADVPMDLADGMLVIQAERLGIDRIATIDSDFMIYRLKSRKPFTNVFLPHA